MTQADPIAMNATGVGTRSGTPPSLTSRGMEFPEFRSELDAVLDECIPTGKPVAILMFPYDGNVGNHLMWIGITDYLRERGIAVKYVAHGNNFSEADLARAIGNGPILFSGGVTVSRLWPRHAAVKRAVAAAFPNNSLISLPSTVLFVDEDDRLEASTIFGDNRNVTLLTRDPVSGAQARAAFPDHIRVVTTPDLAFRLPAQPVRHAPEHDIIWLARDDLEGVGQAAPADVLVFDWPHDLKTQTPRSYWLLRASGILSRLRATARIPAENALLNPGISELYRQVSLSVLDYGNRILDRGRVLVTDRMHPHILAALRGQPCVLLPDKFGKNRAVYDNYTATCANVHWTDTHDEALSIARGLAATTLM